MVKSPFYVSKLRQSRPDGTDRQDRKAGAECVACKAENWGKPSGGADFLIAGTGAGFNVPIKKAALLRLVTKILD